MSSREKFLILNKKYYYFSQFFDLEVFLLVVNVHLKALEERLKQYNFITIELLLYITEKLFQEQRLEKINEFIESKKIQNKNVELFTLPGIFFMDSSFENLSLKEMIIKDNFKLTWEEKNIPFSEVLDSNFYMIHKFYCIFKNSLSLIYKIILKKESFLLTFLEELILQSNFYRKIGFYFQDSQIFQSIDQAIILLELNDWIIKKKELYDFLEENQGESTSFLLNECDCNFIDVKDVNKEIFYKIREKKREDQGGEVSNTNMKKRRVCLQLKKPENILDPMEFYREKILKTTPIYLKKRKVSNPVLNRKKITDILDFSY